MNIKINPVKLNHETALVLKQFFEADLANEHSKTLFEPNKTYSTKYVDKKGYIRKLKFQLTHSILKRERNENPKTGDPNEPRYEIIAGTKSGSGSHGAFFRSLGVLVLDKKLGVLLKTRKKRGVKVQQADYNEFEDDANEINIEYTNKEYRLSKRNSSLGVKPPVIDQDEQDIVTTYTTLRYLPGEDLYDVIKSANKNELFLNIKTRLAIIKALLYEVQEKAHGLGIIHLDIKPQNIRIDLSVLPPKVYLLDYGVSEELHSEDGVSLNDPIGTLLYASLEQLKGLKKLKELEELEELQGSLVNYISDFPAIAETIAELLGDTYLAETYSQKRGNLKQFLKNILLNRNFESAFKHPEAQILPEDFKGTLRELLTSMRKPSPDERPNSIDLIIDTINSLYETYDLNITNEEVFIWYLDKIIDTAKGQIENIPLNEFISMPEHSQTMDFIKSELAENSESISESINEIMENWQTYLDAIIQNDISESDRHLTYILQSIQTIKDQLKGVLLEMLNRQALSQQSQKHLLTVYGDKQRAEAALVELMTNSYMHNRLQLSINGTYPAFQTISQNFDLVNLLNTSENELSDRHEKLHNQIHIAHSLEIEEILSEENLENALNKTNLSNFKQTLNAFAQTNLLTQANFEALTHEKPKHQWAMAVKLSAIEPNDNLSDEVKNTALNSIQNQLSQWWEKQHRGLHDAYGKRLEHSRKAQRHKLPNIHQLITQCDFSSDSIRKILNATGDWLEKKENMCFIRHDALKQLRYEMIKLLYIAKNCAPQEDELQQQPRQTDSDKAVEKLREFIEAKWLGSDGFLNTNDRYIQRIYAILKKDDLSSPEKLAKIQKETQKHKSRHSFRLFHFKDSTADLLRRMIRCHRLCHHNVNTTTKDLSAFLTSFDNIMSKDDIEQRKHLLSVDANAAKASLDGRIM